MSLSLYHNGVKSTGFETEPEHIQRNIINRFAGEWPDKGPVLVAVSGGGDSIALLRLLSVLAPLRNWELIVAHVNHRLRPEAGAEAAFVENLAAELGHRFLLYETDPQKPGLSLEESCRQARHDWLDHQAKERGAAAVVLGHTLDDQAETLLCRALSGSGPTGLAGMRPNRDRLWRPLLGTRREDLRVYLRALGQEWRTDPSNQDLGPLRNRVRHGILPRAKELVNAKADEALGRLAAILQAEEDYWQDLCPKMWAEYGERQGYSYLLDNKAKSIHSAALHRLLRWLIGQMADSGQHVLSRHLDQLMELWSGEAGKKLSLPLGLCAYRDHMGLRLCADSAPKDFSCQLDGPGRVDLPETGQRLELERAAASPELRSKGPEVWIPEDSISWPLTVRAPQSGDLFQPMGSPGKKRLNRFFIDRKTPLWLRPRTAVLCDENGILWVAPLAVSERARKKPGPGAWICARLIDRNQDHAYTETPYNE